jgi:hypothetical protein
VTESGCLWLVLVTPGGKSRNLGLGLENWNPKYTGPK